MSTVMPFGDNLVKQRVGCEQRSGTPRPAQQDRWCVAVRSSHPTFRRAWRAVRGLGASVTGPTSLPTRGIGGKLTELSGRSDLFGEKCNECGICFGMRLFHRQPAGNLPPVSPQVAVRNDWFPPPASAIVVVPPLPALASFLLFEASACSKRLRRPPHAARNTGNCANKNPGTPG